MPPHINQFSVGTLYFQKEDGTLEPIMEVKELDMTESETKVSRYPESIKPKMKFDEGKQMSFFSGEKWIHGS